MKRLAIVALATVVTGLVAMVLAFLTMPIGATFSEEGYAEALRFCASSHFFRGMALTYCFLGTAIAFPLALWALRDVDLQKAIPRVAAVTWLSAVLLGPMGPLAPIGCLFVGGMALVWARANYSLRSGLKARIQVQHLRRTLTP